MEGKLFDEIQAYLMSHFAAGQELTADVVVKQILAGGYVPQRYGYQNMREMFSDLKRIMTVKSGTDGKMTVVIKSKADQIEQDIVSETITRRRSSDVGMLSGRGLDQEKEKKESTEEVESAKPQTPVRTEAEEPDSLSEEIQEKIYAAVVTGLQLDKPIYMSTLSPVLRYAGVDHDKLGFVKSKNMLKRCSDFMEFKEVVMNGVPQTLVTVHHVPAWDEKLAGSNAQRRSGGARLDAAEKKRIYEVLCQHMKFGEAIHMAAFSPILRTYGFDYHGYGFQKVKELAAQLREYLSLEEIVMNGVPQTLVTLHPFDAEQQTEQTDALQQIAFLPPKILSVLSRMTGTPVWACEKALEESYQAAVSNHTLQTERKRIIRRGILGDEEEDALRFPLNVQTMRGDTLIGELHRSGEEEPKPWFLAWVGSPAYQRAEGSDAEKKEETGKRELTPQLTDCCVLSDSVVRAAAFKALHCTEAQARERIIADYADSFAAGSIVSCDEEYYFTLKQTGDGEPVKVLIAPNHIGSKPYYVRYVGSNMVPGRAAEPTAPAPASKEQPVKKPAALEFRLDNAPLPKELDELAHLPSSILSLLAHQCGMLQSQMTDQLMESYRVRKESGKITRRPDEIRFNLLVPNLKGEDVVIILKPGMSEERRWFLQYFECREKPAAKENAVQPSAFEQFAFLGDWNAQLHNLSQLAVQEHWDFDHSGKLQNLKRYIEGVFDRIMKQDKMVYDEAQEEAAFHTGLYNRSGYDICIQLSKNLPGSKLPWRFERFVTGRLDQSFVGLPLPPSFLDSRVTPWFEPDRDVLPLSSELILQHLRLLPKAFLRKSSGALEISLIEQMNHDPQLESGCYARLESCYRENPAQLELMAQAIDRGIGYALYRAKRDYAYVVVGYLPQTDTVVWMLPVTLQGSSAPDIAVAYALEYGSYRPVALLTMQEAYFAARFVRRLEGFWLRYDVVCEQEQEKAKE